MLKYKLSTHSLNMDANSLKIISVEALEYGSVNGAESEEMLVTFKVKDLFGIQSDSHLTGVNTVTLTNEDGTINNQYNYIDELVVDTTSKVDNSFSVSINKEIKLDVEDILLETVYHSIQCVDNKWVMNKVSEGWIKENGLTENKFIDKDIAVCCHIPDSDDVTVFYYENSAWQKIEFGNEELIGYKLQYGGVTKLDFSSFHNYDKTEREVIEILSTDGIYYTKETYISFNSYPCHYFRQPKEIYDSVDNDGMEYINVNEFDRPIVKTKEFPIVNLIYEIDDNGYILSKKKSVECHIENDNKLSFNVNNLEENKEEFVNLIFDGEVSDGDDVQEGRIGLVNFTRNNIMYNNEYVSFDIVYDSATNVIQIPISQKFETDMYHNDSLNTHFVKTEEENAINPIIDLEKDVYTPVIIKADNNNKYKDCYKIIFNLHFREHEGVDWVCEKDSFWNGTYLDDSTLKLKGCVYQYDNNKKKETRYDYFSYFTKAVLADDGKEYQSDLLSYLGFSNDDVKYQKSKLKKSFLRLSFYDSDNIGNQNLLHTATIFLDSGNLFAKYVKHIETEDLFLVKNSFNYNCVSYVNGDLIDSKIYTRLSDENKDKCVIAGAPMAVIGGSTNSNAPTIYDKNGVRINREPMRSGATNSLGDNISDYEELRLSSQFEVTDKNSSKRSSEGFYFYTYKSNDGGVFPSDLYMKVEFNHAGYGRTIPFMMPYVRNNEYEAIGRYFHKKCIKTFSDICDDWSNGNGYSTVKYLKYTYIRWKYRYDKETQKHIYYLDPDIYGNSVLDTNGHGNNIILNLYEGKII